MMNSQLKRCPYFIKQSVSVKKGRVERSRLLLRIIRLLIVIFRRNKVLTYP